MRTVRGTGRIVRAARPACRYLQRIRHQLELSASNGVALAPGLIDGALVGAEALLRPCLFGALPSDRRGNAGAAFLT